MGGLLGAVHSIGIEKLTTGKRLFFGCQPPDRAPPFAPRRSVPTPRQKTALSVQAKSEKESAVACEPPEFEVMFPYRSKLRSNRVPARAEELALQEPEVELVAETWRHLDRVGVAAADLEERERRPCRNDGLSLSGRSYEQHSEENCDCRLANVPVPNGETKRRLRECERHLEGARAVTVDQHREEVEELEQFLQRTVDPRVRGKRGDQAWKGCDGDGEPRGPA